MSYVRIALLTVAGLLALSGCGAAGSQLAASPAPAPAAAADQSAPGDLVEQVAPELADQAPTIADLFPFCSPDGSVCYQTAEGLAKGGDHDHGPDSEAPELAVPNHKGDSGPAPYRPADEPSEDLERVA
jgi:hypothetical protein